MVCYHAAESKENGGHSHEEKRLPESAFVCRLIDAFLSCGELYHPIRVEFH